MNLNLDDREVRLSCVRVALSGGFLTDYLEKAAEIYAFVSNQPKALPLSPDAPGPRAAVQHDQS